MTKRRLIYEIVLCFLQKSLNKKLWNIYLKINYKYEALKKKLLMIYMEGFYSWICRDFCHVYPLVSPVQKLRSFYSMPWNSSNVSFDNIHQAILLSSTFSNLIIWLFDNKMSSGEMICWSLDQDHFPEMITFLILVTSIAANV